MEDAWVELQLRELVCSGDVDVVEAKGVQAEVVHEGAAVAQVGVAGGKVVRWMSKPYDEMGALRCV